MERSIWEWLRFAYNNTIDMNTVVNVSRVWWRCSALQRSPLKFMSLKGAVYKLGFHAYPCRALHVTTVFRLTCQDQIWSPWRAGGVSRQLISQQSRFMFDRNAANVWFVRANCRLMGLAGYSLIGCPWKTFTWKLCCAKLLLINQRHDSRLGCQADRTDQQEWFTATPLISLPSRR